MREPGAVEHPAQLLSDCDCLCAKVLYDLQAMFGLRSLILICCCAALLCSQELPEDLSKSFERSQQRFHADIDQAIEDLGEAFEKYLGRHIKAYEKLERQLKKKGEIDGLKAASARLRQLKKTAVVNVFGTEVGEKQIIDTSALSIEAQQLEQEYTARAGDALATTIREISKALEDFKEAVIDERKRMVKDDRLDAAEQLEAFAGQLSVAICEERLHKVCEKSLSLSPLMAGGMVIAGSMTAQAGIELFRFSGAQAKPFALNDNGKLSASTWQQRGDVSIDEHGFLAITQGSFVAAIDGAAVVAAVERAQAVSVEAIIQTDVLNQQGPARIVSFSLDGSQRNFTIGQSGNSLVLRLRTTNSGNNGTKPEIHLGTIADNKPMHLLLTYKPGILQWWLNGEMMSSEELIGDLSNWDASHGLVFGDEYRDSRPWIGRVGQVRLQAGLTEAASAARAFAASGKYLKP